MFSSLGDVVDTDAKGAISFAGFLELYRSVYSEKGTQEGNSNLLKDLKVLHVSPQREGTRPDENVQVFVADPTRASTPVNEGHDASAQAKHTPVSTTLLALTASRTATPTPPITKTNKKRTNRKRVSKTILSQFLITKRSKSRAETDQPDTDPQTNDPVFVVHKSEVDPSKSNPKVQLPGASATTHNSVVHPFFNPKAQASTKAANWDLPSAPPAPEVPKTATTRKRKSKPAMTQSLFPGSTKPRKTFDKTTKTKVANVTPVPVDPEELRRKRKEEHERMFKGKAINPFFADRKQLQLNKAKNAAVQDATNCAVHSGHDLGSFLPDSRSTWTMLPYPISRKVAHVNPPGSIAWEVREQTLFPVRQPTTAGSYQQIIERLLQLNGATTRVPVVDVTTPTRRATKSALAAHAEFVSSRSEPGKLATIRGHNGLAIEFLKHPTVAAEFNSTGKQAKRTRTLLSRLASRRYQGHLVPDAFGTFKSSNCPDLPCKEQERFKHGALPCETLWVDRYRPQSRAEVCGNEAGVKRLHQWLSDWKVRIQRNDDDRARFADDFDDDFVLSGTENSNLGESWLANGMLIQGPPGCGKSASVYACATELEYEVIEINASALRTGAYLRNICGDGSQNVGLKLGSSQESAEDPAKQKTHKNKPRSGKQAHDKNQRRNKKKTAKALPVGKVMRDGNSSTASQDQTVSLRPRIFLFDEVDVQYPDEKGFIASLRQVMETTSCPVVMTCNVLPSAVTEFPALEFLPFRKPSQQELCKYLRAILLAEGFTVQKEQLDYLVRLCSMDTRKLLHNLQFWFGRRLRSSDGSGVPHMSPVQQVDSAVAELLIVLGGGACATADVNHLEALHNRGNSCSGGPGGAGVAHFEGQGAPDVETGGPVSMYPQSRPLTSVPLSATWVVAYDDLALKPQDLVATQCRELGELHVGDVHPNFGSVSGGTTIRVAGKGFLSCIPVGLRTDRYIPLRVTVDGVACSDVKVVSDTLLEAVSPPFVRALQCVKSHGCLQSSVLWPCEVHVWVDLNNHDRRWKDRSTVTAAVVGRNMFQYNNDAGALPEMRRPLPPRRGRKKLITTPRVKPPPKKRGRKAKRLDLTFDDVPMGFDDFDGALNAAHKAQMQIIAHARVRRCVGQVLDDCVQKVEQRAYEELLIARETEKVGQFLVERVLCDEVTRVLEEAAPQTSLSWSEVGAEVVGGQGLSEGLPQGGKCEDGCPDEGGRLGTEGGRLGTEGGRLGTEGGRQDTEGSRHETKGNIQPDDSGMGSGSPVSLDQIASMADVYSVIDTIDRSLDPPYQGDCAHRMVVNRYQNISSRSKLVPKMCSALEALNYGRSGRDLRDLHVPKDRALEFLESEQRTMQFASVCKVLLDQVSPCTQASKPWGLPFKGKLRRTAAVEYIPVFKTICNLELARQASSKRRSKRHYLPIRTGDLAYEKFMQL